MAVHVGEVNRAGSAVLICLGLVALLAACTSTAGQSGKPVLTGASDAVANEALIKSVIQDEAQAQSSAFAQRNPALMKQAAAESYYRQLVRTNESLLGDGVTALELVALEWGPITVNGGTAEATTFETWKTDYGNGAVDQARDRNRYALVWDSGGWKIRSSLRPDSGLFQPATGAPSGSAPPASAGIAGARSHNWSGYAAQNGAFTAVAASWIVPGTTSRGAFAADSTWVGIGGMQSTDLIQAGTEQRVLPSGKVVYDAWMEMLPQPSQTVPLNVSGGDSITASIEQQREGSWRVSLKNNTTGRTYQSNQQFQSSNSSAEWIEEAPTGRRGGLMPLDDFRSVGFTAATVVKDGHQVSILGAGGSAITMTDRAGNPVAQPSQLGQDGSSFSVARLNAAESQLKVRPIRSD